MHDLERFFSGLVLPVRVLFADNSFMVEHLRARLLNQIKLEDLQHMEYADTGEDRFDAGFSIFGAKLERSCAARDNCYIVPCGDVHANLSKLKINESIKCAYRDEKGEWEWECDTCRVLRHCGNAQLVVADDFWTTISLDRFTRMDLNLDNNVFHGMRANARSMLGRESWLRNILCKSLRPAQFVSLCERSINEQCLGAESICGTCKITAAL